MGSAQEPGQEKARKEKVNRVFRAPVLPFIPQNLPKADEKWTHLTRFRGFLSGF